MQNKTIMLITMVVALILCYPIRVSTGDITVREHKVYSVEYNGIGESTDKADNEHVERNDYKLSRGGRLPQYRSIGTFKVTAYDLSYQSCQKNPGDPGYGITRSGKHVTPWHTVAVDTRVIPFGTTVYIPHFKDKPNHGMFVAEDTGGAIKGNRIDVYMETYEGCEEVGLIDLEVYIVTQ